jgi:hypothetical protein
MKTGVKLYTEAQVRKFERNCVTASKIQDAVAISRYQMSGQEAAEMILKAAGITRAEIKRAGLDEYDTKRLCAYLKR